MKRNLGVLAASVAAVGLLGSRRGLRRQLGRARLPPGSHVDFDAVAAAGASGAAAL